MKRRGSAGGEYGEEKLWLLKGRREGDQAREEGEEGREIQGVRREKLAIEVFVRPSSCPPPQKSDGAPLVAGVAELAWSFWRVVRPHPARLLGPRPFLTVLYAVVG